MLLVVVVVCAAKVLQLLCCFFRVFRHSCGDMISLSVQDGAGAQAALVLQGTAQVRVWRGVQAEAVQRG